METKEQDVRIMQWLKQRGITENVIADFNIHFDKFNDRIVIPVKDAGGTLLFNKYRRAPWNDVGPKYRYDGGANAQLFNGRMLAYYVYNPIIICEGELDCLLLISRGYNAVSSTGGSGTFLEEWASLFDGKEIFICYDNDAAGYKGAFNVLSILPRAKIIWLPQGKDVTEYFALGHTNVGFNLLMEKAEIYQLPRIVDWKDAKGTCKANILYNETIASHINEQMTVERNANRPWEGLDALRMLYLTQNEHDRQRLKYLGKKTKNDTNRLEAAKKTPITQFLEFSRENNALCIWHSERTPSMHYYPHQNRVKCFGCDKLGDVIDVVMQLQKVGLGEAINKILGDEKI